MMLFLQNFVEFQKIEFDNSSYTNRKLNNMSNKTDFLVQNYNALYDLPIVRKLLDINRKLKDEKKVLMKLLHSFQVNDVLGREQNQKSGCSCSCSCKKNKKKEKKILRTVKEESTNHVNKLEMIVPNSVIIEDDDTEHVEVIPDIPDVVTVKEEENEVIPIVKKTPNIVYELEETIPIDSVVDKVDEDAEEEERGRTEDRSEEEKNKNRR